MTIKLRKQLEKHRQEEKRKHNEARIEYQEELEKVKQHSAKKSLFRNYPFLDLIG